MAADATEATRDSPPPRSLGFGLRLAFFGVWLAALDGIADTVITVRLVTYTFDGSKFGELWVLAGARVIVYATAVAVTLALRRRILRRRHNGARIGLIVVLGMFAVGGVANFVITWVTLLGAAMGGDYARPLELWVNYLGLASMAADVVLIVIALTAAILMLAGRRWTTAIDRTVS